jgi:hypothetical protein
MLKVGNFGRTIIATAALTACSRPLATEIKAAPAVVKAVEKAPVSGCTIVLDKLGQFKEAVCRNVKMFGEHVKEKKFEAGDRREGKCAKAFSKEYLVECGYARGTKTTVGTDVEFKADGSRRENTYYLHDNTWVGYNKTEFSPKDEFQKTCFSVHTAKVGMCEEKVGTQREASLEYFKD